MSNLRKLKGLLSPVLGVMAFIFAAVSFMPPSSAQTGQTIWGAWTIDWIVKDGAGLNIRDVFYDNERVFWKASHPVIRVKYNNNSCGPYADRINSGNLLKISNCGNKKVCQRSFSSSGKNWLELGVLAKIGQYQIYQAWYFSHDGQIDVRMWGRGLQCNVDHDHHAYWRMDFDIDGAGGDQVFVFDSNRPNEGWGPGWHKFTNELNDVKNAATSRKWFVRDNSTSHGFWVLPGPSRPADSFSTKDMGVRRYRSSEDEPWPFGAWGHLGYLNGESVEERDIIIWYVGHLFHPASAGPNQWEWVGPYLIIHR